MGHLCVAISPLRSSWQRDGNYYRRLVGTTQVPTPRSVYLKLHLLFQEIKLYSPVKLTSCTPSPTAAEYSAEALKLCLCYILRRTTAYLHGAKTGKTQV